ncbi:hypothetical protein DPMN_185912 [Dreissena polymorpha]|uniref:Uncharacterized protein n=2 Tax=Dreissena polymorpha TaxID=45954 RepID=A0A9D4I8W0_DREPO|nr:hypothetical protein DPMN_185912 [Dreissena polymorpha]
MVSKARESLTMERKNARQTGGGQPMKAADTVTMSIIETMKETPSFSGIPGASQSETTIGAVRSATGFVELLQLDDFLNFADDIRPFDDDETVNETSKDSSADQVLSVPVPVNNKEIKPSRNPAVGKRKEQTLRELQMAYYAGAIAVQQEKLLLMKSQREFFEEGKLMMAFAKDKL